MTTPIRWLGPPPSTALSAALATAGFVLGADGDLTVVAATRGDQAPVAPADGRPWLWVTSDPPRPEAAREAVRREAYDVVALSADDGATRLLARLHELAAGEAELPATPSLIAESPASRAMLRRVLQVARSNMPVLLTGETGSGKEETANLIHRWSARRGPWMAINCAAIPDELMESELFGHARGAFSGAVASVDGKLMAAQGGTVFLDEIDDTPLSIQNKLLRALEDGEITRVGETRPHQVDFRTIAATNRDLLELIARGTFGQDLYERLAIVRLDLPPLRARREDIPPLARYFLGRFFQRLGEAPRVHSIRPEALDLLVDHPWPGNIRELRNVIYQALVFKRGGDELLLSDLRRLLDRRREERSRQLVDEELIGSRLRDGSFNLRAARADLERAALRQALAATGGNAASAARLLGEVGRGKSRDPGSTLRAMMRRLGVEGP
jgi:DNA-binding NtrC family response regulator